MLSLMRTLLEIWRITCMSTRWTLGIIDIAIAAGIAIDKKASVDHLRQVGFRISEKLYQKILKS